MVKLFQYYDARNYLLFSNKRKHVRCEYPSSLKYYLVAEPSHRWGASTVNISASGLCLCLDQRLPVGQRIGIDSNILPTFWKTARVRWIKQIDDGRYFGGFEFCPGSSIIAKYILDAALI